MCKARLNSSVRRMIYYLNREVLWRPLDDTYAVAELRLLLPKWERPRRFVFVREKVKTQSHVVPDHFMWIKALAYNLLNWFRQILLPIDTARADVHNQEDYL